MDSDSKRDETLLRMLKTPPQKRASKENPNGNAEELTRELDMGTDADLDKIARIVGNK